MSTNKNKLTNLTEIPLGLEQGDNNNHAKTTDKTNKIKTNSLKRFFRTAKSSMTTSKSSDDTTDVVCESEMKNVRSLQLRFGSFHKKDEKVKSHTEPSSSTEALKLNPTESRLKLQDRISNYWTTAFKKSLKKSSTINDNTQIDNKATPTPNEIDKFEDNQSGNL